MYTANLAVWFGMLSNHQSGWTHTRCLGKYLKENATLKNIWLK